MVQLGSGKRGFYSTDEGVGNAEYFVGCLAAAYVGEVVRFVACVADLIFGGARLVGAVGLAGIGACVQGLGLRLLGGQDVYWVLGAGDAGLVYAGGLVAANEGYYLLESGTRLNCEDFGPEVNVPDTADDGDDVGKVGTVFAGFVFET